MLLNIYPHLHHEVYNTTYCYIVVAIKSTIDHGDSSCIS